jgi:hypothetical protein
LLSTALVCAFFVVAAAIQGNVSLVHPALDVLGTAAFLGIGAGAIEGMYLIGSQPHHPAGSYIVAGAGCLLGIGSGIPLTACRLDDMGKSGAHAGWICASSLLARLLARVPGLGLLIMLVALCGNLWLFFGGSGEDAAIRNDD